ncbi:MAG: alpha/beta hydrolase [Acidobacteria bacterium]|nr:alpha/beta hydrolase [Acidobacteriota bacterium]
MPGFEREGIHFYFEQSGSGIPFLYSHGLGGDLSRSWDVLGVGGIPGTRLIVFDNRGHGRTRPMVPSERLTFTAMADDAVTLLDHLSLSSAILGGTSMGAGIAACAALRHPQRVKALVLAHPAWLDQPNPPNLASAVLMADLVARYGPQQAARELEHTDYFKQLLIESPEMARVTRAAIAGCNPEALVPAYMAMPASTPVSSLQQVRELEIPALVLGSRGDDVHPFEYAEIWARALPGGLLRELPVKTLFPKDYQRDFHRLVSKFILDLPAESS